MARKTNRKPNRAPRATPQTELPYGAGMHEEMYGPGVRPSLYNGQNSAIAPQIAPAVNVTTSAGLNATPAAQDQSGLGAAGGTQRSLMPAGSANPMTVFSLGQRRFPLSQDQGGPDSQQ